MSPVALSPARRAEIEEVFEHALDLDPGLVEARQFLAQVFYRRNDLASAIDAYETLARSRQDH